MCREEAVEALIEALDCEKCNAKVQEQMARALLMFGGCLSYTGEATAEDWLLQEAGFHEKSQGSFHREEIVVMNLVSFTIASSKKKIDFKKKVT